MALGSGIYKQVSFKRETTYGTAPGASGFALLRRVQSTIDLTKDVYESNEIRADMQTADYRHGVRRVRRCSATDACAIRIAALWHHRRSAWSWSTPRIRETSAPPRVP